VSLEYRLYDEPVLGDWKIVAVVNGRKTEQSFSVQQYGNKTTLALLFSY
jgi:hypothetical protein